MNGLAGYTLPIGGMKQGIYDFDYQIDKSFFDCFEDSFIKEGNLQVKLELDKRSSLYVLDFKITGTVQTTCDRCLEEFSLDIESEEQLIVKFSTEATEEAEVIYLPMGTPELSVAQYIYEFIALAVPIRKVHPNDESGNMTCNKIVLKYLVKEEDIKDDNQTIENPIWGDLKKKFNKN